MKKILLNSLQCIHCSKSDWTLKVSAEDEREIRTGTIICKSCQQNYSIHEGILAMYDKLSGEVEREKTHAETFGYLKTADGEEHPVNRETIENFRHLFLSLPAGDGSVFFKPGGSFENQAGNAERFFKTIEKLNLTGREKILEVGASFGWASWRMAQRGCEVVALDITNYLMAGDLYFTEDGTYFDRVNADMSRLPFCDETFDIIFSHSVIHHCKDLKKAFKEFHRVLKSDGRVVALHECAFGIFEDKSGKSLQKAIQDGVNENAYTIPQWKKGAIVGGFKEVKIHYFSFIDDYIYRKKLRGSTRTIKINIARWIQSHSWISQLINSLSILPRIFLRPKAWMMIATK